MRKSTAAAIMSASIVAGATSTEVIFDYMEHSTAQDLRECANSIGESGCSTSFLSGYVTPIIDISDAVYRESYSPMIITQAADQRDESTEGKDRRDRKKLSK